MTILEGNKVYLDVEIIPENITEKLEIIYLMSFDPLENDTLKVILQPKIEE